MTFRWQTKPLATSQTSTDPLGPGKVENGDKGYIVHKHPCRPKHTFEIKKSDSTQRIYYYYTWHDNETNTKMKSRVSQLDVETSKKKKP